MSNPYESPSDMETSAHRAPNEIRQSPSRWLTIPVGAIIGALFALVAACGLAFVALMPPWARFLGLSGEFDVLLVFSLPILALPGGALGGFVFGVIWGRRWDRLIALLCASLPAVALFISTAWRNEAYKNPRDQFVSTSVCAICMILAAAISLKTLNWAFLAIERYKQMSDLSDGQTPT